MQPLNKWIIQNFYVHRKYMGIKQVAKAMIFVAVLMLSFGVVHEVMELCL